GHRLPGPPAAGSLDPAAVQSPLLCSGAGARLDAITSAAAAGMRRLRQARDRAACAARAALSRTPVPTAGGVPYSWRNKEHRMKHLQTPTLQSTSRRQWSTRLVPLYYGCAQVESSGADD